MIRSGTLGVLLCLTLLSQAAAKSDPKAGDKMVEVLKKKNYEAFVEELGKEAVDANQPDSKGRLPLIEAVRTKDIKFVDALMQFGAFAKSKDPATGASPLHIAFQQNLAQIAHLLLAYGADINAEDKTGKKPRDFAPSMDIRQLILDFDQYGHQAFEDAPGTWAKDNKDGDTYWFNQKTGESRWNTPPSCGWLRIDVQGQPHKYVNTITGQEVHRTPNALAWRKVRTNDTEMWYNWAANTTQLDVPGELPDDLLAEASIYTNVRWYNEKTGEFAWEDPAHQGAWRQVSDEEGGDGEGHDSYYFNVVTGQTTWEVPEELAWTKVEETEDNHYFFNTVSGESTFDVPDSLAWTRHDGDL